MRMLKVFAIAAVAALSAFAARADSITITFPMAGAGWCALPDTCGNLGSGGYTGQLKNQLSFVTGQSSDPVLKNFVATGFSATMNVYNTQYGTIDIFLGTAEFPYFITGCCGGETFTTPIYTFATPSPVFPLGLTYELAYDIPQSNPSTGNWIAFTEGSVTLYGAYATPESATWAMMLLGFAGVGFAGYRTSRKAARTNA